MILYHFTPVENVETIKRDGLQASAGIDDDMVGSGTSIAQIFAEIEQELRSQYRFGFTPLPSKPGKFHSIELRAGDKHQTIQARAGYYTPE